MKKTINTVLAVLLLSTAAAAQQPRWTWEDGALAAGIGADFATTRYAKSAGAIEVGAIKNDWARLTAATGFLAAMKLLDYKRPESGGKMRWVKRAVFGALVTVAIVNVRNGRR